METALLTGASGFTGHYMAAALRRQGYRVVALQPGGPNGCDLTDRPAVEKLVRATAPQAVVHLAGVAFVAHSNPEEFYRVNLFGTLNLIESLCALQHPPRKVLISSSANVYGTPAVEKIDESMCPQPVNHYACSKLAMENMVRTYFDRIPIVITRPFNYTGPGQSELFLIPKIVQHFRARRPMLELGNLAVVRDFSDVEDVITAYIALLNSDLHSDIVNICSGNPFALTDVIQMMNEVAGYTIDVRVNPALVRSSDVLRLVGNPAKLRSVVELPAATPFLETLRRMYEFPV